MEESVYNFDAYLQIAIFKEASEDQILMSSYQIVEPYVVRGLLLHLIISSTLDNEVTVAKASL